MREEGMIAALVDLAGVTTSQICVWLSVTFAYLTVAYLAGAALSRF
ncbi:MAG: hypothetical protein ACI9BW_003562 [Gammaproteobacteria bacterium]|jgi:hypothetical protein